MPALIMRGEIERRLLINYRVDPDVLASLLPAPFRPLLVDGTAVAGICLIRLGALRPRGWPSRMGLTSENAAHRFAVTWSEDGATRTGVYIPLRHSSSLITVLAGDRVFPGAHDLAGFCVDETATTVSVAFADRMGRCSTDVSVEVTDELSGSSLFPSLADASAFFRASPVGLSPNRRGTRVDGLELRTSTWRIEPAAVRRARSSFYDDRSVFPRGSIELDSALIMRGVPVDWHPIGSRPIRPRVTTAV